MQVELQVGSVIIKLAFWLNSPCIYSAPIRHIPVCLSELSLRNLIFIDVTQVSLLTGNSPIPPPFLVLGQHPNSVWISKQISITVGGFSLYATAEQAACSKEMEDSNKYECTHTPFLCGVQSLFDPDYNHFGVNTEQLVECRPGNFPDQRKRVHQVFTAITCLTYSSTKPNEKERRKQSRC